ncbi:dihydrolipoyllysine-residue succinyltransferase, partial [Akkermansiaceae bacterium]|nr:dihydrolipoyllysine-residue succinyltransferase [Akkermansiaceae bacterium]
DKVSSELEAEASGTIKIEVSEGEEVDIGATLGTLTTGSAPVSASIPQPAAAPEKVAPAPEKKSAPAPVAKPVPAKTEEGRVTRKKMTPLRRKIAQHLVNAQQTAAILTTFNEADMSAVMKLRKQVQEDFIAKHGVKLGFMSFFVKAVVQALKEVPSINARIDGTDVIQNHFFDIGVAIGTEKGLVVPVLRDCDKKSFAQIEQDILDYAFKARDGKIGFDDLSGGVFTVSNGGVYGSLLSTPILNPPQSGILGMHTIQQRPMAVNEEVKILPMMYLAMSYDHRLVDGKEAVTFLISIKNSIENPTRLMLEM